MNLFKERRAWEAVAPGRDFLQPVEVGALEPNDADLIHLPDFLLDSSGSAR